jgi:PPOX class probable F420-dependent enzyme
MVGVNQLSDAVRRFLEEPRFAVLATINPDGTAQQTVMWYELRSDGIMMNTVSGRRKHRNIRRDPRVSICIEDGYRYVSIDGTVTIDDDVERGQEGIYALARRYHPGTTDDDFPVYRTQQRLTLFISIDKIVTNGFS